MYEEKIKENELLIEKNNAHIDSLTLEQSKVVELNKINEDLKKQNRLLHEQIEKGKQSLSSYFVKLGDQVPYFYRLKLHSFVSSFSKRRGLVSNKDLGEFTIQSICRSSRKGFS